MRVRCRPWGPSMASRGAALELAGIHQFALPTRTCGSACADRGDCVWADAEGGRAAFCVAPATAHRWWHRRLDASAEELASGAWLFDRSSRPRRSPRLLSAVDQERICEARRRTGWGPRLVAGATGFSHSTVWKVLYRHGLSRPPQTDRQPANRYEWPCPGDLLHTWTRPAISAFCGPVTRSRETARSAAATG